MSDIVSKRMTPRGLAGAAFQFSVSIALIYWASRQLDFSTVGPRLTGRAWVFGAIALLLMLGQVNIAAWRWRRVNQRLDVGQGYFWHWRIVMCGLFFSQFLPSTFGGDAYRIWSIARGAGSSFSTAFVSVVSDRAIGLASLLCLIAAGLPLVAGRIGMGEAFWSLALVVGAGLVVFVSLVVYGKVPFGLSWFRIADTLMAPARALRRILATPREIMLQFGAGISIHVLSIMAMVLLAAALRVGISVTEAIALVPPVLLFSMLPISVAGWGLREGAMVAAFALIGRSAADAVLLSLAFGLANVGVGLVGGLVWGLRHRPGDAKA